MDFALVRALQAPLDGSEPGRLRVASLRGFFIVNRKVSMAIVTMPARIADPGNAEEAPPRMQALAVSIEKIARPMTRIERTVRFDRLHLHL